MPTRNKPSLKKQLEQLRFDYENCNRDRTTYLNLYDDLKLGHEIFLADHKKLQENYKRSEVEYRKTVFELNRAKQIIDNLNAELRQALHQAPAKPKTRPIRILEKPNNIGSLSMYIIQTKWLGIWWSECWTTIEEKAFAMAKNLFENGSNPNKPKVIKEWL